MEIKMIAPNGIPSLAGRHQIDLDKWGDGVKTKFDC